MCKLSSGHDAVPYAKSIKKISYAFLWRLNSNHQGIKKPR
jgi:hypothetical protein